MPILNCMGCIEITGWITITTLYRNEGRGLVGRGSGALPIVSTIISKATRGINLSIEEGFGEGETMYRCITNEEGQLPPFIPN